VEGRDDEEEEEEDDDDDEGAGAGLGRLELELLVSDVKGVTGRGEAYVDLHRRSRATATTIISTRVSWLQSAGWRGRQVWMRGRAVRGGV
jgi:hypothetical protein